ncbi:O-antigen ligase family protein [Amycolatopsis anabasis]|uniref:O-antigen ligase family protein n=1 Tax=Amycolatopsis anabasis TaxID=1840409 RepID=UPI001FE54910|nr:O-antigen ligase family protein [Amycolatopsis anabasis]
MSGVHVVLPGPTDVRGWKLTRAGERLLQVSACATVGCAPIEGYLLDVQAQLAKLPTVLLAASWCAVRIRRRERPLFHPVHALLAALAAVVLLTTVTHLADPFAVEYAVRWLPFLVVTAILIDVAAREVPPRALLAAAVAGALVAGVGALYSVLAEGDPRATGPLQDPNDLAYVLVAALPLLVALTPLDAAHRRRVARPVLAATAAAVLILGAAMTLSRGGGFALLAATGWLVARRVLPLRVLAGALAAVALAAVALFAGHDLSRALDEKTFIASSNVDAREVRWQAAARMFAENPVLGVGPGGFRGNYATVSHNAEIAEPTAVAHNMYLEVAAELGLPGFALFVAVIAGALVASERAFRASTDRRPMAAVQASLIAVLVASAFLSEQYYLSLWSMVALACAADLRTRPEGH